VIRALGRRLRGWRAGAEHRVAEDPRFAHLPPAITLRSAAFEDGGAFAGADSPPLAWDGVPAGTQTLVLIVEDVDAPLPRPFVHAVVYGIAPAATSLAGGVLAADGPAHTLGYNGLRRTEYRPPHPLPGHGPHRYVFTLLAVDFVPRFDQPPSRGRVLDAIAGHALALGELTGVREG
jgi:Raf kinase inhibitor-like YbhB/YbcL family protein